MVENECIQWALANAPQVKRGWTETEARLAQAWQYGYAAGMIGQADTSNPYLKIETWPSLDQTNGQWNGNWRECLLDLPERGIHLQEYLAEIKHLSLPSLLDASWRHGHAFGFKDFPERQKAIANSKKELQLITDRARRKGFADALRGGNAGGDWTYLAELKRAEGLSEEHRHWHEDEITSAYAEGWRTGRANRGSSSLRHFCTICLCGLVIGLLVRYIF
jgi:ribosome modulation factor